jgi:hypothetical protein
VSGELEDCILYYISRIALPGGYGVYSTAITFIVASFMVDGEKGFLHKGHLDYW